MRNCEALFLLLRRIVRKYRAERLTIDGVSPITRPCRLPGKTEVCVDTRKQLIACPPLLFKRSELGNGLVLFTRKTKSERVFLKLAIGAGAEEDPTQGVAHLVEHTLFENQKHYGAHPLFEKLFQKGTTTNGETTAHYTAYEASGFAKDAPMIAEALCQMVFSAHITREAFKAEREIATQEMYETASEDWYDLWRNAKLYPGLPFAHTPFTGSESSLKKITYEEVTGFYEHWYAPENAALIVIGNVKHDEIQKRLSRPSILPLRRTIVKPTRVWREPKLQDLTYEEPDVVTALDLCFSTPTQAEEYAALEAALALLSEIEGSLLFTELRQKLQATYGAVAQISEYPFSQTSISAFMEPRFFRRAEKEIFRSIKRLSEKDYSDDLLDTYREMKRRENIAELEDPLPVDAADDVITRWSLGTLAANAQSANRKSKGAWRHTSKERAANAAIDLITRDQIADVVGRYLSPKKFARISVIEPKKKKK